MTRVVSIAAFWLAAFWLAAGLVGADAPSPSQPPLDVVGFVPKPLKLDAESLAEFPRRTIRIEERDGATVEFEGTPLFEILKAAGLGFGEDLRGLALADYLVVEAADGYKVVFAIPELDPAATDRVVLLAYRRDGAPLDAKEGPLRLIVPEEKRRFRWVRQVTTLRVGRS